MTITSDLDMFRLEIGDTDVDPDSDALLSDDECQYFLDTYGDILPAAAAACDALSRRFARAYDFAEDGQSFSRSQMSKQYAELAIALRRRVTAGISNVPTTRVDGYSQTIDYDDVEETSGVGRARIGWTDPDLPL